MPNKNPLPLALAALLLTLPALASAQEADPADDAGEESMLSWNAAVSTDYMFRGVSQTDGEASLQLGADLSFDNGLYVGIWGSNVDFGDGGPDLEVDTYIGWNTDLNERWNLDLGLVRYNYIGEQDGYGSIDYNEFLANLALDETWTFTFGYTNDVYALDDDGFYYGVAGSFDLGYGWGLDATVGRSTFGNSTGIDDYLDYSFSVNRDFGPVNAALGYYGTDSSGDDNFGEAADNRFLFTLSIGS